MHNDLKKLKKAISKQIKFVSTIIAQDPSKLHRSHVLALERLLRIYLQIRQLYAGDSKEVKITVELIDPNENQSNKETLENTGQK